MCFHLIYSISATFARLWSSRWKSSSVSQRGDISPVLLSFTALFLSNHHIIEKKGTLGDIVNVPCNLLKKGRPPPMCMVWMYTICTVQVWVCWFLGHSSSPVFSLFLCHTPNLLSVRPKWLHLPVSLLSISFPHSSLHPAAVSLPQLALGLRPGGLSAPEDHDGLHRCLCQWCRAATGPDLCPVHFTHRFHREWGRQKISEWIMTVCTSTSESQVFTLSFVIVSGRLIFQNVERILLKNVTKNH